MKKKMIQRGLLGFPLGIAIGFVITVIISMCIGDGSFYPVTPELIDTMKNELLKLSLNVKGIQSDLYFTMEKLLKGQFLKLIELMHTIIYNFLQMKIDYVDDSEEMSDSRAVKLYAETCMSQLNDMLMNELPELLNEEFKIAVEDRVEDLSCRWKREIGCDFGKAQKQIEQESTTTVQRTMGFQPEVQRTMGFQPEVQRTMGFQPEQTKSLRKYLLNHFLNYYQMI